MQGSREPASWQRAVGRWECPPPICTPGGLPGVRAGGTPFQKTPCCCWSLEGIYLGKAIGTEKSFSGSTGMRWDVLCCAGVMHGSRGEGTTAGAVISRDSQCHGPGGLRWGSRGIIPFGDKEGFCHRVALLGQGSWNRILES